MREPDVVTKWRRLLRSKARPRGSCWEHNISAIIDRDLKGLLLALWKNRIDALGAKSSKQFTRQLNNLETQQAVNLLAQLSDGATATANPFFNGATSQRRHCPWQVKAKDRPARTRTKAVTFTFFARSGEFPAARASTPTWRAELASDLLCRSR